jgi:CHAT domain-containing protein
MPSLQLLRPTATVLRRPLSIASLGLGYEDRPWGLSAMRQSVEEATAVAAWFHTEPLVDAKATKAALRNALTTARFVHLSAHGRLDVSAPAFQHVFLAPDDNSDGRFFAHEVLGLDLRGLELLTLSACETALERFDSAYNPRGLVAAFLLSGVRRVIGTLWPVAPEVSKRFFTVLYGALAGGAGVIDAYRAAQRETRAAFPEYWHWGAFYLISGAPAREQED